MRAQLRTYHSIPSLQAHQDPNAYKQLQDAPRLKSILKGASEDSEQPVSLDDVKNHAIPRTNPVNLIFILSQYAPKISEVHFPVPRDFFDLVMKPNLSSRSRATGFLWLMWWYLESHFTKEDALNNPYGPGQYSTLPDGSPDPATDGLPVKLPAFESLTDSQAALENVDTKEEEEYGEMKRQERIGRFPLLFSSPSSSIRITSFLSFTSCRSLSFTISFMLHVVSHSAPPLFVRFQCYIWLITNSMQCFFRPTLLQW